MAQFDALNKAKKAAEQAARAAKGIRENATAKANELREKAALTTEHSNRRHDALDIELELGVMPVAIVRFA